MKAYIQYTEVNKLIQLYNENGGQCVQTDEGCLGAGDWILTGEGLKTTIIKEIALNEWSTTHSIRLYNKCPQKYQKILENF